MGIKTCDLLSEIDIIEKGHNILPLGLPRPMAGGSLGSACTEFVTILLRCQYLFHVQLRMQLNFLKHAKTPQNNT